MSVIRQKVNALLQNSYAANGSRASEVNFPLAILARLRLHGT
jgi:hypothetical protein